MRVRIQTTEHPFGTPKTWMGYMHLQIINAKARQHRDKPESSRLQLQTGIFHSGGQTTDGGNLGVNPFVFITECGFDTPIAAISGNHDAQTMHSDQK